MEAPEGPVVALWIADAAAAEQKIILAAKRKESDAQMAVNKINSDLSYAQQVLESAELIVRTARGEIRPVQEGKPLHASW